MFEIATGLKAAYDIARAAKDVNDQVRLNTAISEILDQLSSAQFGVLELQEKYQQIVEENRELKELLQQSRRFERYRLVETPMGDFIFELKEEHVAEDEPAHAICVHCREGGRLSILSKNVYRYRCRHCAKSAWIKPPQSRRRNRTISSGIR